MFVCVASSEPKRQRFLLKTPYHTIAVHSHASTHAKLTHSARLGSPHTSPQSPDIRSVATLLYFALLPFFALAFAAFLGAAPPFVLPPFLLFAALLLPSLFAVRTDFAAARRWK